MNLRTILILASTLLLSTTAFADNGEVALASYDACDAGTKAVVQKVVSAFGGEKKIDGVFNLHIVETDVLDNGAGREEIQLDALVVFPDSVRALIRSAGGTITLVVSPDSAFMVVPGAISGAAIKLDDDQREVLLRNLYSDPLLILRRRHDRAVAFGLERKLSQNGKTIDILRVDIGQQQLRWFIDDENGRILRTAVGGVEIDLRDWKTGSGMTLPFAGTAWSSDRKEIGTMSYQTVEVNVPSDTSELFRTPTLWLSRMEIPESALAQNAKAFAVPDRSGNATGRRVFLPDYGSRVYVQREYVYREYVTPVR